MTNPFYFVVWLVKNSILWISDCDGGVECWWGEGKNSVEQDIMQVQCLMDVFTLRIHMYNIIDGIVGIKFSIVL